jgi:hypothetical protein
MTEGEVEMETEIILIAKKKSTNYLSGDWLIPEMENHLSLHLLVMAASLLKHITHMDTLKFFLPVTLFFNQAFCLEGTWEKGRV